MMILANCSVLCRKDVIILFTLWIEIDELTDGKVLYSEIEAYRVNLTELVAKTYVYGVCTLENAYTIISLCEKYSPIVAVSLKKELV